MCKGNIQSNIVCKYSHKNSQKMSLPPEWVSSTPGEKPTWFRKHLLKKNFLLKPRLPFKWMYKYFSGSGFFLTRDFRILWKMFNWGIIQIGHNHRSPGMEPQSQPLKTTPWQKAGKQKNRSCVTLICCSFVVCYTYKLSLCARFRLYPCFNTSMNNVDTFCHDPAWYIQGLLLLAWFNWDYEMDKQPDA